MSKFAQGVFRPMNTDKYVGKGLPRYRSGWELAFMQFCDNNNHVLQWASESIVIPYRHPFTGKMTNYIPDFLVVYADKHGRQRAELVEIKPKKQSIIESKASNRDRAVVAVNYSKWDAATKWCRRQGLTFRVINEDQLFRNGKK
jgi:hypothetical protein